MRSHSHSLETIPDTYVFKTGTDFWIFFKMEGNTITIKTITDKQTVFASVGVPEAES